MRDLPLSLSGTPENCSKTWETMTVKPLQSAHCVCVRASLYLSPQLPPLMELEEWDVERKGV